MSMIWDNSGDSHFLEPDDLWAQSLPPRLAALVPRSEKDPDGLWETVHIDGQSFRRKMPSMAQQAFYEDSSRAPGARDSRLRLLDLDQEGIWAEVVFPSLGLWSSSFRTPEVLREALRVSNDWAVEAIMNKSHRLIPTAQVSTLSIKDATDELVRAAGLGYRAVFMPTKPHPMQQDYNFPEWEPFWSACVDLGMPLITHAGALERY